MSKSIGLAIEVHLPFLLCFTLLFQVQAPGGLYLAGLNYTRRGLFSEFYGNLIT